MYGIEWIYYRSTEAGLLGQCNTETHAELSQLQTKASELREQSLRASISSWDGLQAFCRGLSFKIMRCTRDAKNLKIRIEVYLFLLHRFGITHDLQIALEAGLRNQKKDGKAHFLTTWNPHVGGPHCICHPCPKCMPHVG
ncbi:hypothetical protein K438DRAFT_1763743 [Mycena galopus ATCC 62051]|nr:hypothetical protein K438DRAFT_1763743 [Mycena galopus ATCC 62051]